MAGCANTATFNPRTTLQIDRDFQTFIASSPFPWPDVELYLKSKASDPRAKRRQGLWVRCGMITLVLYRKRTARRFRLASTSGVRFRYSRQKEAARGCGGRGVRWEFNRFLPEKPCQTGTLAKTLLLIFIM